MTNLSTEAKAELQRMIDIGATQMRAQGCCSMSPDDTGFSTCMYRGDNGFKCFGGALIADEHYRFSLEGKTICSTSVLKALTASGYNVCVNKLDVVLQHAQCNLHDDLEFSKDFPAAFEAALITYCSEYGLDYTAPGETL
jgi:hypothetical protein